MNELDWQWVHEGEAAKYMEQLNRRAAIKRKPSVRKNKTTKPVKLSKEAVEALHTSGNLPDWTGVFKAVSRFFGFSKPNV